MVTIDAIFIDGDHSHDAVYDDIDAWWPKVKPGGIMAGHDIDEAGVAAAVKTAFADFDVKGRCWVVRKSGVSPDPVAHGVSPAHLPA